jgi:hypothetical protein
VGDYIWSDEPKMRPFIKGYVISVSEKNVWLTIALDSPLRRYAMIKGGRLRINKNRIIKPDVLDRLALEASSPRKTPRWPSAEWLKMAIS